MDKILVSIKELKMEVSGLSLNIHRIYLWHFFACISSPFRNTLKCFINIESFFKSFLSKVPIFFLWAHRILFPVFFFLWLQSYECCLIFSHSLVIDFFFTWNQAFSSLSYCAIIKGKRSFCPRKIKNWSNILYILRTMETFPQKQSLFFYSKNHISSLFSN